MSNRRQILIYSILIFCFACEVLCSTFLIKPEGDIFKAGGDKIFFSFDNNNFVSILYFLGGIGVAILPLLSVKGALCKTPAKYNRVIVFAVSAMAILLFSFGIYYMVKAFIQHPVDFHYADMLPIMKAQNERLINGQHVYAPIPEVWNEYPVYMPGMWLPFLPALFLHFDMRWVTLGLLFAGILIILLITNSKAWSWRVLPVILILFVMVYYLLFKNLNLICYSEEGIVIFYYLLLATAIVSGNSVFVAIAITLCGLSRYSFLGWALFYIPFLFFTISRKKALRVLGLAALFSLLVLISSKSIGNLWSFVNMRDYYLKDFYDPNNIWKYKSLIAGNLGLAKFFPFEAMTIVLYIQYGLTILFPAIAFLIYKKFRTVRTDLLLLCFLKLDLVLFYNTMIMPWHYLFYTSTFLSAFILMQYMTKGNGVQPSIVIPS